MYGIYDYLDACGYRKDFLLEQREWMILEREQHDADAMRLQGELDRVRQEMAGYLIPEINDEYVTELQHHLDCPGLIEIKSDYERQFDEAENRRIELESLDEIQNYKDRIHFARMAENELRPEYDQLKSSLGVFSDSKWFTKLNQKGYFEQDYQAGFFGRFFDWRSVSFLMADVEKGLGQSFDEPEQLKSQYRDFVSKSEKLFPEFESRTAERERISGLKSEHEMMVSAPERLLAELYRDLGARVIEHIQGSPEQLRLRIASADSGLNEFMKREAGIQKQIEYLRQLSVARIDLKTQEVDLELDKVHRKIHKLQGQAARGKVKRYTEEDIRRMRNVKAEKWQKRRLKTEKLRRRISDFKKYDKGSWEEDYLWWDLITNRSHGDDIYDVHQHRQRYPDWDHRKYKGRLLHDDKDDFEDDGIHFIDDAAEDLASSMAAHDDDGLFDPS